MPATCRRKCLWVHRCLLGYAAMLATARGVAADDVDRKFPLDPQLRVLAEDVKSPSYRKLVLEKMLSTDLAAEWQRVATADNPESFLEKHGGKDRVFADPELKKAYERRVAIRKDFLELMRAGFKRYNQVAPFDKGEQAELAGTVTKSPAGPRLALSPVLPAPGSERFWPRFRGPSGQGLTGQKLPTTWDQDGTNILWRVKVPASGNSSPIIWGQRLFLTGASTDGQERWLYCYHSEDGKLIWDRKVPALPPEKSVRDKNGFASATPTTDGERIIAFFGSCGLLCYDFDGNLLWRYTSLRLHTTHGTGSSPLLYKDKVIFAHDQNLSDSIFLALDKRTGRLLWQTPRPRAMGWSTPVVVQVGDHDELVLAGNETVKGYDPETGKEIWSLSGPTTEVVPVVVVGPDLLYSASGRNGPTLGLRPGGHGNVTQTHLAWRTVRGGPHVPSPIYLRDRLYTVNDTGVATCLNAQTGRLIWQQRLPGGFSASPIEAGGFLYFPSENGITYVIRASDQFEIVARNRLGAGILASPAAVDGRLFLRTTDELVCIGSRTAASATH